MSSWRVVERNGRTGRLSRTGSALRASTNKHRQADAWHAFGSADSMARKSQLLDRLAEQAGRDPKRILRSSSLSISEPLDQARRKAERLREAGFGYLVVSWPAEGQRKVEEFVKTVISAVASAS